MYGTDQLPLQKYYEYACTVRGGLLLKHLNGGLLSTGEYDRLFRLGLARWVWL